MPNYIRNKIELIGDESDVLVLLEEYSTYHESIPEVNINGEKIYYNDTIDEYGWLAEDGTFTRRKLIPVNGIPDGYEQSYTIPFTRFPDFKKVMPQPKGLDNWYQWNINNWGTKWNSQEIVKHAWNIYEFDTAWASVPNIIDKMSEKHPNVKIILEYSDEDFGNNCGIITGEDGHVLCDYLEDGSIEAFELGFKLKPSYREYFELVDGEYKYIED